MRSEENTQVREHYSVTSSTYRNHYDPKNLYSSSTYPAEYFRLCNLIDRLKATGAKHVLDAGCGEGTPMLRVSEETGAAVRGFDFTPEMVHDAKELFKGAGLDPDWVIVADVEKYDSFEPLVGSEPFDAAVCFGVMPHVDSEEASLKNLRKALKTGGRVHVEFRNALFNLITMNRYTHGYLLEELFADVPEPIRNATAEHLSGIFAMDKPPMRTKEEAGKPGYDAIRARMHNPITIGEMFTASGFKDAVIHWYHFHPTLPLLEGNGVSAEDFRKAAIAMEDNPSDPRGYFLCSAFVVEAVAA